jgi:transcriptional regulator with XRE-family HTH domain
MAAGSSLLDQEALYLALDAQRRSRGLSWQAVADTIGVSASTIARVRQGGMLEADGVLAMVRWLGRTPESFTAARRSAPRGMAAGDRRTSGTYLRVDTRALHAALEAALASRGLTWQQVAREVSATLPVSGAMLTRLSRGGRVTIDVALALAGWLGRTVESLTRPSKS